MQTVLLVVHLIIAVALVGVVLLQRSEGGALGIGGGGGGGGFMTGRGAVNLLTRTTGILAAIFILTSLGLAILAGGYKTPASILDAPESSAPAVPSGPTVPQSQ